MNGPNILMIIGGLAWLIGELAGVQRNSARHKKSNDTTSEFIWHLEARWPLTRVLVGVFVASLFGHLLFGTYLLP